MAEGLAPGAGLAPVAITGLAVRSAFGRGTAPLLGGVMSGRPAFSEASRFDTSRCRAHAVAELTGNPVLTDELCDVISEACDGAGLDYGDRATATLLLALHTSAAAARDPVASNVYGDTAAVVAQRTGLPQAPRVYVNACVAASTAVADAAAMICSGRASQLVVAAGYLVDADSFYMFDAGRTLAKDGQVRPFSAGRQGLLLGDGAVAVVLEATATAGRRGAPLLAYLAGWGRAGDAYHVCQPRPDGAGLARAVGAALSRARVDVADVGYVNANGTGTSFSDASEAAAIYQAFGSSARSVPVSSTKSVHGHALEASALLELVVTVLALQAGLLPVNSGFLAPDEDCTLDLVLGAARPARIRYALSLNAAFGGANTALLVEAAA